MTVFPPKLYPTPEALISHLGKRADAFRILSRFIADRVRDQPVRVVETGCIRALNDFGAGYSTMLWALMRHIYGERFSAVSVDNSPANVDFARSVVGNNVNLVCSDSVAFLQNWTQPITLLYLDSYDLDHSNPQPSALHHLAELLAVENVLEQGALVAVDDHYSDTVSKGLHVADRMRELKMTPIYDGLVQIWGWLK